MTRCKWLVRSVTLTALTLMILGGVMASRVAASTYAEIHESEDWESTGVYVPAKGSVTITCGGEIWAGVFFTGTNGPTGWNENAPSGQGYPLPGARKFSAIGKFNGQKFYIGTGMSYGGAKRFYNNSGADAYLELRVNDDKIDNGSGYFSCNIN